MTQPPAVVVTKQIVQIAACLFIDPLLPVPFLFGAASGEPRRLPLPRRCFAEEYLFPRKKSPGLMKPASPPSKDGGSLLPPFPSWAGAALLLGTERHFQ